MERRRIYSCLFVLVVALLATLATAKNVTPAYAGGVVGNGTPASCTEAALDAALAGGGVVTFNCGAAPRTITFTDPKSITLNTTIDGGGTITFSGQDTTRLFEVSSGAALILRNITLTNGFSSGNGGAIYNGALGSDSFGSVVLENSTIRNSRSGQSGGAIVSTGPLTITNSLLENNQALNGGALYPRFAGARTTIISSTLRYNKATDTTNGWGGALLVWDGAAVTIQDSDIYSNTASQGGGIFAYTDSTLSLSGGTLRNNSATNDGGGLLNASIATLTSATFVSNSAPNGGGLFNGRIVTLTDVIFNANTASASGGGLYNDDTALMTGGALSGNTAVTKGGGVFNGGVVTQTGVTFSDNTANNGGGVYNDGPKETLTGVTFSGNYAAAGGGLYIQSGDSQLTNVTFNGNVAEFRGGGLYNTGTSTFLTAVSFIGNSVSNVFGIVGAWGGGLANTGLVWLENASLSNNSVNGGSGGGLYNIGTANLMNVTISGNSVSHYGGGAANAAGAASLVHVTLSGNIAGIRGGNLDQFGGTMVVQASIVANSPSGGNCGGTISNQGFNLATDGSCGFNQVANMLLDPLADNGGSTLTHLPQLGSPAIDFVATGCPPPATDQRGAARPVDGDNNGTVWCDAGAVEYGAARSAVYLPLVIK